MNLKLNRLDGRRLQVFEQLMSGKEFGGCFCAVWHNSEDPAQWKERCSERPEENLQDTQARVEAGAHVGYLVSREVDGTIVGWTGSGPKTNFTKASWWPGSQMGPQDDSAWVVGCLAMGFEHRSRGYTREIVELLAEEAAKAGASVLEAYPTDPCNDDSAWCGNKALFQQAGFEIVEEHSLGERKILRMARKLREDAVIEAADAPAELGELRITAPASPKVPEPEGAAEEDIEEQSDAASVEETAAALVSVKPAEPLASDAPAHDVASVVEKLKAQPKPEVPAQDDAPVEAEAEAAAETEAPAEAEAETATVNEAPAGEKAEAATETEVSAEAEAEAATETEAPAGEEAETAAETSSEPEAPADAPAQEKKDPA